MNGFVRRNQMTLSAFTLGFAVTVALDPRSWWKFYLLWQAVVGVASIALLLRAGMLNRKRRVLMEWRPRRSSDPVIARVYTRLVGSLALIVGFFVLDALATFDPPSIWTALMMTPAFGLMLIAAEDVYDFERSEIKRWERWRREHAG